MTSQLDQIMRAGYSKLEAQALLAGETVVRSAAEVALPAPQQKTEVGQPQSKELSAEERRKILNIPTGPSYIVGGEELFLMPTAEQQKRAELISTAPTPLSVSGRERYADTGGTAFIPQPKTPDYPHPADTGGVDLAYWTSEEGQRINREIRDKGIVETAKTEIREKASEKVSTIKESIKETVKESSIFPELPDNLFEKSVVVLGLVALISAFRRK